MGKYCWDIFAVFVRHYTTITTSTLRQFTKLHHYSSPCLCTDNWFLSYSLSFHYRGDQWSL